jgi:hypothetical protein
LEDKNREAKEAIRNLLEILNAKYVSELRKDPHKEAEFLHSDYSPLDKTLKRDMKIKLREILQLVQMAIVKMYVEADDNGNLERKVIDFFAELGA